MNATRFLGTVSKQVLSSRCYKNILNSNVSESHLNSIAFARQPLSLSTVASYPNKNSVISSGRAVGLGIENSANVEIVDTTVADFI